MDATQMVSVMNLNYSSSDYNNGGSQMRDRGESFDVGAEEKSFSDRGNGGSGDKKPKFHDRRKIFLTEPEILKTK